MLLRLSFILSSNDSEHKSDKYSIIDDNYGNEHTDQLFI